MRPTEEVSRIINGPSNRKTPGSDNKIGYFSGYNIHSCSSCINRSFNRGNQEDALKRSIFPITSASKAKLLVRTNLFVVNCRRKIREKREAANPFSLPEAVCGLRDICSSKGQTERRQRGT